MAAFDAPILEKTQPPVPPAHSDSFLSDSEKDKDSGIGKDSEKDKEAGHVQPPVEVATDDVGEVFDDVRVIDLDENGKERPIGEQHLYLIKIRLLMCLQRAPATMLRDCSRWRMTHRYRSSPFALSFLALVLLLSHRCSASSS